MAKPLYEITFRLVGNRWINVAGDSATTLADYLRNLDIIVDDKCEFARFKDYEKKLVNMVQGTNNENNNNNLEDKYTIIATSYRVGQIVSVEPKENVRTQCEKLRKLHKLQDTNEHMIIEVVNNATGEMREYWNSNSNEIKF